MANKFRVINNLVNDNLVGLQFAAEGGTPLFTIGNFQIDTTFSEKQNRIFSMGKASEYYTLEDIGETAPEDNILRKNKTKLILNPNYNQPKSYAYFGSLKEYFRVNIEQIITNWPASIYVDNVIDTFTGDTVENYSYNPVTNISTFRVNTSFFINNFDIKYVSEYTSNENLDNPLRNLNLEYSKYTIFYNDVEYNINSYTGSTQPYNDYVYFKVIGNPFFSITGNTLSTKYHIKPNSLEVEKFFSTTSDLATQLLDRYVSPAYTAKFTYLRESDEGPFDIYVNQLFTWPVLDGYNLDIVSTGYTEYLTNLYEFCDYFDENDTNIMNRRLVAESINRLNTIRRGDGSEDENEAEKVSKLINIFAREFDEVKKYVDGLSYIKTITYDKNGNTPDSLVKDLSSTLGWSLLTPMSDVDLISSFIPTQSVYSGYTINYSKYDAEIEFWRRLIVNTAHIWRSKGSRKAIEFLFEFIGTPEQLVSFNEHVYIAKKPINVNIFRAILEQLTGFDDITPFNLDENGFPKVLPETAYNYYQSNGLWYRETAGDGTNINIYEGNNPHIGPYDGGEQYINQFTCLIDTFSATSISIFTDYIVFTNLFKNYSDGLINDYSGQVYLNSYALNGTPNICFSVTGTVTTDPDPQYVLGLCGCPISVSDHALVIGVTKKNTPAPCITTTTNNVINTCNYITQGTRTEPPIILFSSGTQNNIQQVPLQCCTSNVQYPNATWVEISNGLGYCYWRNDCGKLNIIGSSNGNLIFYNSDNGRTGFTSTVLDANINTCCSSFGGTITAQGYCQIIPSTPTGRVSAQPKANYFGDVSDLGYISASMIGGGSATNCSGITATTIGGVVYNAAFNPPAPINKSGCCRSNILGINVTWDSNQNRCLVDCPLTPVKDNNGNIVLNSDGTISFLNGLNPANATLQCCSAYSTPQLPLTFCGGQCYWTNPSLGCNDIDDFKISLGVDGNDGVYLISGTNETCYFQVEFDMLVNFDCSEFVNCVGQDNILSTLSAFTINATIENMTGRTLQTFPALNFNIEDKPTGIYFSGQESVCNTLNNQILIELSGNCSVVTEETFASKWVKVSFNISNQIIGQKIKLGFQFLNIPCNFNFLLDNIKIDRLCIVSDENILNVSSCVGFDLDRIIDNKKSWEYTTSPVVRSVDYLDYRNTNYLEKDSRLLINSKEVDLTLDAARAIDNDVLCYIVKNDCFFTASTLTSDPYIIKYKDEIDNITDVEAFKQFVLSRLIDPKSRQVIRNYPLLRYVYDKYLNLCGLNICNDLGNQYNYDSLQSFIKLIGDYWIELIEQLVPSTALWKGATRFYRNTVFDQPKYKYKNYSLEICSGDCTSIIVGGTIDCVLPMTPQQLFNINSIGVKDNSYQQYYFDIINCWKSRLFSEGQIAVPIGQTIFSTLPSSIQNCITSSGNSLDAITLSVNANIGNISIFDEIIISGDSISDVTGLTQNYILNSILSGFTNNGYIVTDGGENGFYVTSPNDDDCEKQIEINYCKKLDLSCVSGGSSSYPIQLYDRPDLGTSLRGMDISSGNTLYIVDYDNTGTIDGPQNNRIIVFDCVTNSVVTYITNIGLNPSRIVYNSLNNKMYLLTNTDDGIDGYVFVIDCSTNTIVNYIYLTPPPTTSTFYTINSDIVHDNVNNTLYISDYFGSRICVIDCNTDSINRFISLPPGTTLPQYLAFDSVNNKVYCFLNNRGINAQQIVYFTTTSPNLIGISPSNSINGVGPVTDMKYDSANDELYIISNNTFSVINPTTNILTSNTQVNVPTLSNVIAYCNTYNKFYVVNTNSGQVSIIDMDTYGVLNTPTLNNVAGFSYETLYNATENLIYITNQDDGTLTILEPTSSSITISASCETCVPVFIGDFKISYGTGSTEVFDCTKCVAEESNKVEVIRELIPINYGSGSTINSCVETNNKTICSEVFIKAINDDVTFSGKLTFGIG